MSALVRSMTAPGRRSRIKADPTEIARYPCRVEGGNDCCVVVYRVYPGLDITSYKLEDGSPLNYIDDCRFEVASTGVTITRCL